MVVVKVWKESQCRYPSLKGGALSITALSLVNNFAKRAVALEFSFPVAYGQLVACTGVQLRVRGFRHISITHFVVITCHPLRSTKGTRVVLVRPAYCVTGSGGVVPYLVAH